MDMIFYSNNPFKGYAKADVTSKVHTLQDIVGIVITISGGLYSELNWAMNVMRFTSAAHPRAKRGKL